MSDYKRLLSYIYAYDGDYKMNGCGFAKMEVRDDRYRLMVNLNCPLSGLGREYRVCVYKGSGEELEAVDIGGLEARNGGYIFAVTEGVHSFAKGRISIEGADGIVIYREPGSRLYITSWSDPFVEIRVLRECIYRIKKGSAPGKEEKASSAENNINPEIVIKYEDYNNYQADAALEDNKEALNPAEDNTGNTGDETEIKYNGNIEINQTPEDKLYNTDKVMSSNKDFIKNLAQLGRVVKCDEENHRSNKENELKAAADAFCGDMAEPDGEIREIKAGKESQLKATEIGELWHEFKRMYPKMRPFSEDGWEVLQIRVQDIGRLSRENWILGNNNFVLHGYYRYGYLILARKHKPDTDIYVLGVPGTFSINEKFMASMFGMSDFIEADRKRLDLPKSFGYWCTHINM